jgi:hypothetical protein
MAEKKSSSTDQKAVDEAREKGDPVPVSAADDGPESRLHKGYADAPEKPDETTIAQVQEVDLDAGRPPGEGEAA